MLLIISMVYASDCPDVAFTTPLEARVLAESLLSEAEQVDDTRTSLYNAIVATGCVGVTAVTSPTDTGCWAEGTGDTEDLYTLSCEVGATGYDASGEVQINSTTVINCVEGPYTLVDTLWRTVSLHDTSGSYDPMTLTVEAAGHEDNSNNAFTSWSASFEATFADGSVWNLEWYTATTNDALQLIDTQTQTAAWPSCGVLVHYANQTGNTNAKENWTLETLDHTIVLDWDEYNMPILCSNEDWTYLEMDGVIQTVRLSDWSPLTDLDGDDAFAEEFDCDDTNPDIHGCAVEVCDGVDNNCDGQIDETAITYYQDADGDGYGQTPVIACALTEGLSQWDGDCDDTRPDINPVAGDDRCDGIDMNCNGIDEARGFLDQDGDDYGTDSYFGDCRRISDKDGDCDDHRVDVNPGADEICDRRDNDCDRLEDTEDDSLVDGVTVYEDVDGDGWGGRAVWVCDSAGYVGVSGDCDDNLATVFPDALEVPNGVDDDCDGLRDESDTHEDKEKGGGGCSSSPEVRWAWIMGLVWLRRRANSPIPRSRS